MHDHSFGMHLACEHTTTACIKEALLVRPIQTTAALILPMGIVCGCEHLWL